MTYQPEKQDVLLSRSKAELLFSLLSRYALSEMRIQRMLYDGVWRLGLHLLQVLGNGFAESHMSGAAFQEVFRQRRVEESLFMRDHIVKDGHYLAVLFHLPGYISERRCEV